MKTSFPHSTNRKARGLGAAAVEGARLGHDVEVGPAVGGIAGEAHHEVLERVDVVVHFHLSEQHAMRKKKSDAGFNGIDDADPECKLLGQDSRGFKVDD